MKRRKTTLPRLAVYAMSKAELVRLLNAAEAFPTLVRALEEIVAELRKKPRSRTSTANSSKITENGAPLDPKENDPR